VPLEAAAVLTDSSEPPFVSSRQSGDNFHPKKEQQSTKENRTHTPVPVTQAANKHQPLLATAEPIEQSSFAPTSQSALQETPHQEQKTGRHNLLVVGQYDDLYIFCKNSDGLLVIDQHAAHERLLYEKLRRQYLAKTVARQILMFPETVELSLFQAQLVEKNEPEIDRLGFTVREFGGNTYIISAVPALAGTTNPRDLFLDILEQFGSEQNRGDGGGFLDTILATMACRAAVKAGTTLSTPEIDTLLNEMTKADLFSHCPHGRPVVKQFTRDEVKKWFYRG
jgi:DNA mismatch repair protein MutL